MNGIERKDVSVVAVGQERARVLANEIGAERHVAAEPVLLVIGVGPGDVVPKIARVIGARERPEGEDIPRRHRRLGVVDRLIRRVQRESAARAQQAVEAELDAGADVLTHRADRSPAQVLADPASDEGREEVPAEPARVSQPFVFQLGSGIPRLQHDVVLQCPTDHRLVAGERLFDELRREIFDVVHVVIEPDDLERLELERDLVQDSGKPIAGPNEGQELGILSRETPPRVTRTGLTHLTPVR